MARMASKRQDIGKNGSPVSESGTGRLGKNNRTSFPIFPDRPHFLAFPPRSPGEGKRLPPNLLILNTPRDGLLSAFLMTWPSFLRTVAALGVVALFASCAGLETAPQVAPGPPPTPPGYWNGRGRPAERFPI